MLVSNDGNDVSIIGRSDSCDENIVEGVEVINIRHKKDLLSKLWYIVSFIFRLMTRLNKDTELVITYNLYGLPLWIIETYCKLNSIKIVADVVEWYQYEFIKNKLRIPGIHLTMTNLNKNMDGLIVISSFLDEYYCQYVKTFRLPPVSYENYYKITTQVKLDSDCLNLVFAGASGNKDLLNNIIIGTECLVANGNKIKLHIIGATTNSIKKMYGLDVRCENIIFYGYLTHQQVVAHIAAADFSVILRHESLRYAKAGFSTKFVESLSCGTPVIANLSGDIGNYLIDGINGFVSNGHEVEDFVKTIERIFSSRTLEQIRSEMKTAANDTYMLNFSPMIYCEPLVTFCEDIINKNNNGTI